MEHRDIIEKINKRFERPSRWGEEKPRILFWVDSEGEFKDTIETEFDFGDIKLLVLDKYNGFHVKYIIEHADKESKYLIYMPYPRPKDEDNILADTMHYCGTPFSADKASIICMDLQIDVRYSSLIKEHMKFFNSMDRTRRLAESGFDLDTEDKIRCGMIAVTLGCRNNDINTIFKEVLKRYSADPTTEKIDEIFDKLEDYGLKIPFWDLCCKEYGTPSPNAGIMPNFGEVLRLLFISYLANNVDVSKTRFESYVSKKKARIFTFINGMYNDRNYSDTVEILSQLVAEKLKICPYFREIDTRKIAESDAFACIDEIIIEKLSSQIVSTSKPLDPVDVKLIESRKKMHYGEKYQSEYNFIEYGTMVLDDSSNFFNRIITIKTPKELLDNYSQSWHRIDRYYRNFIVNSDEIHEKTDTMEKLAELVENTYNNRFLDVITEKLCSMVKSYKDLPIPYQTSFFSHYLNRLDRTTVVIISDAFRYECVAELREVLEKTSRVSDLKLDYMVSTIPSITKFGMAALLPNRGLQVTHDGKYNVLIDGQSTDSLNREKILQNTVKDSVKISFKEVMTLKQDELRSRCAGKKLIYIYHDTIDAIGDNATSEIRTFNACGQAITEIKDVITLITNKLSYTKFIITADHGFIYRRKQIEEVDKVFVSTNIDANKRYALTDKSNEMINSVEFDLTYLDQSNSGLYASVPSSSKIFRTSGAGQNYVHGGLSPQEIVVPVLTVIAAKGKVTEEYVGITPPVKREIKKQKQTFDFLQTNPVNDKYREADYEIYFTNEDDVKISDTKRIPANKREGDEQWFNVQFNFSGPKKGKAYLHINNITDPDEEPQKVEFNLNIMFALEGI